MTGGARCWQHFPVIGIVLIFICIFPGKEPDLPCMYLGRSEGGVSAVWLAVVEVGRFR